MCQHIHLVEVFLKYGIEFIQGRGKGVKRKAGERRQGKRKRCRGEEREREKRERGRGGQ